MPSGQVLVPAPDSLKGNARHHRDFLPFHLVDAVMDSRGCAVRSQLSKVSVKKFPPGVRNQDTVRITAALVVRAPKKKDVSLA
jgi:hypothetical protein